MAGTSPNSLGGGGARPAGLFDDDTGQDKEDRQGKGRTKAREQERERERERAQCNAIQCKLFLLTMKHKDTGHRDYKLERRQAC